MTWGIAWNSRGEFVLVDEPQPDTVEVLEAIFRDEERDITWRWSSEDGWESAS